MKRKAATQENGYVPELPRKLPAIAEADTNQPLRPSRTAINKLGKGPPELTKPRAPVLSTSTTRRIERATSAPPRPTAGRSATSRPTASRPNVNRPSRVSPASAEDKRFQSLQDQVSSIESARAADAARLAADMELERAKLAELQTNHLALSRELAAAKTQELTQRRELDHASDELDLLRKKHAREVEEMASDARRKEREMRELREDLRMCQGDLERERETVASLKSTISHQSTAQLSLSTQISAMQAQIAALQAQLDTSMNSSSELHLQLESAQKRVADLERETREAESVRRKLHNMVQELKGNIRVFCRVRPLLSSDVAAAGFARSTAFSGSSSNTPTGSPDPEDEDRLRKECMAQIAYPDKMDYKEIVLSSSSESATGQERKDEWAFSFDRVRRQLRSS